MLTLGTVSCFSELDIHCLKANNLPTPPKNILLYGIVLVVNDCFLFFLFMHIMKKKKVEHDVAKVRRMIRYVQDYLVIRCMPISFFHHKVSPHTLTQLLYHLWWGIKTWRSWSVLIAILYKNGENSHLRINPDANENPNITNTYVTGQNYYF